MAISGEGLAWRGPVPVRADWGGGKANSRRPQMQGDNGRNLLPGRKSAPI